MATGGLSRSRQASSESKQRSNWQRTTSFSDRDDALSLNSLPSDVRINNWDFSDWRPNSSSVNSKRKKKSKGNPEREREQSLSMDSPPQEEKKQRTPSTFSRTKITPSTPTSQRVALENLRTHMTFSDFDDQASTDGEPNNERAMSNRRRVRNNSQETANAVDSVVQLNLTGHKDRSNRNNNRDDPNKQKGPDSNQIVGRLMQIRDYIKQANTMLESLQNLGDSSKKEEIEKVKTLIQNLQEQEKGYLGLLQRSLSMPIDRELVRDNVADVSGNNNGDAHRESDSESVDLEVQTNASETTENSHSSSSRPRIEDKLGLESDEEAESKASSHRSEGMDNTLMPGQSIRHREMDMEQSGDENENVQDAEKEAGEELSALRQQQQLLEILIEKQKQLKSLQERQAFLVAKQKDAERRLAEATAHDNQLRAAVTATSAPSGHKQPPLKSNIVGYPESDDDESSNARASDSMPTELLELRHHLNYMRNELRHETPERDNPPNNTTEAEAVARQQLKDKLRELQEKKGRMDDLLNELQVLQSQRLDLINNESDAPNLNVPQTTTAEAMDSMNSAEEADAATQLGLHVIDAQEKLRKLQEVRERLNQLRDLVQYYQSVKENQEDQGDPEEQSSIPGYSDYGDMQILSERLRDLELRDQETVKFTDAVSANNARLRTINQQALEQSQEQSNEENASDAGSNEESGLSSLGPWGDDPELQEKVQKLKLAKERLRQLQDLVAFVQQSSDATGCLPENLADLAASLEGETVSHATQTDDPNVSVSEGEVIPQDQREENGSAGMEGKMKQELEELEKLRAERRRLLAIQEQLKALHEQFPKEEMSESFERNEEEKVSSDRVRQAHAQNTPVVTFASNDELYSKMRKQRMLREELRQKKKELEAIMRKDRNKRQYFRNQDNQSDTVSYSTDAFGSVTFRASASADATMATWGGSTVDNLENITEYDDRNEREVEEDDDGYPSDGIVQVEEEEEENDSDNGTYTIEEDARQRRSARAQRDIGKGARPKTLKKSQSFPQPLKEQVVPKQMKSKRKKARASEQSRDSHVRQENYQSAEDIVVEAEKDPELVRLEAFQQQLEQTSQMCQLLLREPQALSRALQTGGNSPAGGMFLDTSHRGGLFPDMQQQIQLQQLMMCINQCYQQLAMQQLEMRNIQHQLNQVATQLSGSTEEPQGSPITPMTASLSTIPNSTAASINLQTSRQTTFALNPQFPIQNTFPSAVKLTDSQPVPDTTIVDNSTQLKTYGAEARQNMSSNSPVNNLQSEQLLQLESYPRTKSVPKTKKSTAGKAKSNMQSGRKGRDEQREHSHDSRSNQQRYSTPRGADIFSHRPRMSTNAGETDNYEHRAAIQETGDDSAAELSLFEALRETIYSEVATLISQNESRPHFLIELFRELQMLTTDYLRQRALYSIQDLLAKTLVENNNQQFAAPRPPWLVGTAEHVTASELTPSESLLTSDEEEVKARLREHVASTEQRKRSKRVSRVGSLKNAEFDYIEAAENTSSLSTPNSNWESPFAQDSLGDTVIHFDKAMEKMKEYERQKEEENATQTRQIPEPSSSSAVDQGSESSISDIVYPRIDTTQLDQQIKAIMSEVIPVIREHMEDVCSPQLLAYIKRLVLSLVQEKDASHESTPFFSQQLGSVLQDSLMKFDGRKMRECRDDLLIDISEVLFNELAFFRLMQNLEDPSVAEKMRSKHWLQCETQNQAGYKKVRATEEESDGNESSSEQSDEDVETLPAVLRMTATEEDDLGKDRDDELANETNVQDADEKDEDAESPYKSAVQIELAVSETKPFTRIGSDEDDDEEDESLSAEDPSETAVSRDAKMENTGTGGNTADQNSQEPERNTSADGQLESSSALQENQTNEEVEDQSPVDNQESEPSLPTQTEMTKMERETAEADGNVLSSDSTNQENCKLINGETGDLTVDDLPTTLNVTEPSLIQKKMENEDNSSGVEGILQTMDTENQLAGDPNALPDPDSFVAARNPQT